MEEMMMDGDMKKVVAEKLYKAFADSYAMQFQAHGFHWNVVGADFMEFHNLFGKIYEDVDGATDAYAENIRKLGFEAPCCLEDIIDASDVEPARTNDAMAMVGILSKTNEIVNKAVLEAFAVASAANEQGIADFLAGRDDMHKKWAWFLRSYMGQK